MKINKPIVFVLGFIIVLAMALLFIQFNKESTINKLTGEAIKETSIPIGNISYEKVKSDTAISTIIDSSQLLDNGNLVVKFHHNSNKEEPISIIGNVRYELSKTTAKPNEEITLTVFDWSTEYFEIKIGKTSSVVGFGKKSESLDNDEVVLKELTKQKIDKKDVVLEKDYGKRLTKAEKDAKKAAGDNSPDSSPFSKIYKDTNSGKNILVASGLPMVDDKGLPIDVGWTQQGNRFVEKNNLFKATVDDNNVELIIKNDQPDETKYV